MLLPPSHHSTHHSSKYSSHQSMAASTPATTPLLHSLLQQSLHSLLQSTPLASPQPLLHPAEYLLLHSNSSRNAAFSCLTCYYCLNRSNAKGTFRMSQLADHIGFGNRYDISTNMPLISNTGKMVGDWRWPFCMFGKAKIATFVLMTRCLRRQNSFLQRPRYLKIQFDGRKRCRYWVLVLRTCEIVRPFPIIVHWSFTGRKRKSLLFCCILLTV